MQNCQDTFSATFTSYNELFGYQQQVSSRSQWSHCAVNQLHVEPLNHNSSCYPALKEFAPGVSSEAVEDSFNNLGLAIRFDQKLYPVRETAYRLKEESQAETLTPEAVAVIMGKEKVNKKETLKIPIQCVRKFFPASYTTAQIEEEIVKLCETRYRTVITLQQ